MIYTYYRNEEGAVQEMARYTKATFGESKVTAVENEASLKAHWKDTRLPEIFKRFKSGDALIVLDAPNLACSMTQILEILKITVAQGVAIHFIRYQTVMKNDTPEIESKALLNLISRIQNHYTVKRTHEAIGRRKASGLPLGRPKGRKNKALKLDPFKADIEKYMTIGVSKASIAKLVACHPQTLHDWLGRREQQDVRV